MGKGKFGWHFGVFFSKFAKIPEICLKFIKIKSNFLKKLQKKQSKPGGIFKEIVNKVL